MVLTTRLRGSALWRLMSLARSLHLSGIVLSADLVKEHTEDHDGTRSSIHRDDMAKHKGRNADGEHLSCSHNDSEHNRSEFFDGVEDAELSTGRRNGRDDIVVESLRIGREELDDHWKIAREDETSRGNADSADVHSKHHLVRIHVGSTVLGVYLVLPLRSERVKANVHEQEDQPAHAGLPFSVTGLAGKRKDGNTAGDQDGLDVLSHWVCRAFEDLAHDHDWNDFRTLEDSLHRERHILERGVLTPTTHRVAESTWRESNQRCFVVGKEGSVLHTDRNQCDNHCEKAIAKDAKGS